MADLSITTVRKFLRETFVGEDAVFRVPQKSQMIEKFAERFDRHGIQAQKKKVTDQFLLQGIKARLVSLAENHQFEFAVYRIRIT